LNGQGQLIVPATPTSGSAITTGDRFKFQYGTMSAWIKLPAQVGYWPAFWTLNNNANGVDALPLGEVDVLEGYTTWNNVYHAVGHNWTGNSATNSGSPDNYCPNNYQARNINLSAGFHKYSAKVEPNKISYYFDDEPCGQAFTKEQNPGKPWGFGPDVTRGNWLILTMAIGGAGGQQKPAVENAQMIVDRVEVRSN
jgi:beta-glucanase (GH16 family)